MAARSIHRDGGSAAPTGLELPLPARELDAAARRMDTHYKGRRVVWRSWGSGPAVVLLHGGFGSWMHWLRTIPALSGSHTMIAPDMPGFGDSDLPASEDLLRSIPQALIAGLPAVLGEGRGFDLVGFSFGSVMAGEFAADLSDSGGPYTVRRLVMVAPAGLGIPASDFAGLARTRPGMTRDELAEVHRHNMAIMLFKNRAAIDDVALALQMANTARAHTLGRRYSRSDALAKAVPRIRGARVLAVWGDGDAYALRDLPVYRDAVARLCPGIRIQVISGGGHWVQYEAADAFNAVLINALREEPPS
jgi:2-hydroxy-6-oxonona-2,4-dienedioate hydrolase